MQVDEWNAGIIVVCGVVALLVGLATFFATAWLHSKRISNLNSRLEQAKNAQEATAASLSESQQQLRVVESRCQDVQISEAKLSAAVEAANESLARQVAELERQQRTGFALQQGLEEEMQKRHLSEKLTETANAEARAAKELIVDLRERLASANAALTAHAAEHQEAFNALQERHQALGIAHSELKTTLEAREEHFREQLALVSDSRRELTKEFENLANKIFEEKGKTFTHVSEASIRSLLKPFREQIEGFQRRANEIHDASLQGNTSLGSEIKKILEIGMQMSKEANNLASALKGDSQQRGAWGEAQLRRTLEMSGLVEEVHYECQTGFKDEGGRYKQTDYLVKLPDGKHMIIDSKVSLVAYDRAVSAATPEESALALAEHCRSVRKHIDDLASKDYTNLVGMRSPGFVLMFMPIEPAYIEALKQNKDLFDYGYKKGIVLVSHTTLIPILRTVSHLWMIDRSNVEAREVSEKAGEIYNQVCLVAERFSKLGSTLSTASNHYNDAVKAFSGKQGLYGKVGRFKALSTKANKSLPAMEPSNMDFEVERLSLIVEAIEDDQSAPAPPAPLHFERNVDDAADT